MDTPRASYKLKRFLNSRDPDFAAALLIYVRNTPLTIRTDSDEIAYWIDTFADQFGDPFYVFGFFRDRTLVGYAQAAYFREEQLIALDYITIDPAYRRNNVFYEFVEQLKQYLENIHPEYRYAVAEICYGPDEVSPAKESGLLARLLKLQGFRVIHAPYYQPRLADENPESEVRADLLVYSNLFIDKLRVETFLSIVRTLYYKYYLRWKNFQPSAVSAYKNHLDNLYSRIESELRHKQVIFVNGYQDILAAPNKKSPSMLHDTVSFSIQALIVVILLTAAMLGLRFVFKLSNASFALIYVLAIFSFVAVAGIVSREARIMFAQMSSLAKYAFGRQKASSKQTSREKKHAEQADQNVRE